jgi:hypothetical protein
VGGICFVILGFIILGIYEYVATLCIDCSSSIPYFSPLPEIILLSSIYLIFLGVCLILVSLGKLKLEM